jgi:hypothetical protein
LFLWVAASACAVSASMGYPDYMLWILLPLILGFPIIATIVNLIKGKPLLRKGWFGLPMISYDIEDGNEVPSMNLTARSLDEKKP